MDAVRIGTRKFMERWTERMVYSSDQAREDRNIWKQVMAEECSAEEKTRQYPSFKLEVMESDIVR